MFQQILVLALAPFIGSFVGVIVRRLPIGLPIALDRSRCEHCHRTLSLVDLVPILSFLWLRGRCRQCGTRISPMHLGLELAAIAVATSAILVELDPAILWVDCVLGWTLLALACIDWTHLRLPDVLTLPLLLAGLAATAALDPGLASDHAAAAAVGYLALRLLGWAYQAWRGREGLGGGDAKMLAAAGAWVGLEGLGPTILIAALMGITVTALQGRGLRANTVVPFGTFLALGTWLTRLYVEH
ncbi:A24 family peptidase [Acidisphaera sp. L21]|uniref:prepilin peptidase n=1 Tax=Acidisphaera sp. L21 TaxID=1641851 RepID=UPI00131E7849